MNSVIVNPGIYSGAVDSFLEISAHLFLPYVSNLMYYESAQKYRPAFQYLFTLSKAGEAIVNTISSIR